MSLIYAKFNIQFTTYLPIYAQDFFFKNQLGAEYDLMKICMFNAFYCAGDEITKLTILYDAIIGSCSKKPAKPTDEELV